MHTYLHIYRYICLSYRALAPFEQCPVFKLKICARLSISLSISTSIYIHTYIYIHNISIYQSPSVGAFQAVFGVQTGDLRIFIYLSICIYLSIDLYTHTHAHIDIYIYRVNPYRALAPFE